MIYLAVLNALLLCSTTEIGLQKTTGKHWKRELIFFLRQGIHCRAPTNNVPELFSQKKVYYLPVFSNPKIYLYVKREVAMICCSLTSCLLRKDEGPGSYQNNDRVSGECPTSFIFFPFPTTLGMCTCAWRTCKHKHMYFPEHTQNSTYTEALKKKKNHGWGIMGKPRPPVPPPKSAISAPKQ